MVGNEKVENEYIGLDIGGMQGRGRVSIIDDFLCKSKSQS